MDDHIFIEHKEWMAFQRNSFHWPKAWQKVIYKVEKVGHTNTIKLWPRNPDYQEYLDRDVWMDTAEPPTPYLPPVEFETMDEVNAWVDVCKRLGD